MKLLVLMFGTWVTQLNSLDQLKPRGEAEICACEANALVFVVSSCSIEVWEQRHEYQAVQLFSSPILASQFHGCFHLVPAICWGKRCVGESWDVLHVIIQEGRGRDGDSSNQNNSWAATWEKWFESMSPYIPCSQNAMTEIRGSKSDEKYQEYLYHLVGTIEPF